MVLTINLACFSELPCNQNRNALAKLKTSLINLCRHIINVYICNGFPFTLRQHISSNITCTSCEAALQCFVSKKFCVNRILICTDWKSDHKCCTSTFCHNIYASQSGFTRVGLLMPQESWYARVQMFPDNIILHLNQYRLMSVVKIHGMVLASSQGNILGRLPCAV